METILVSTVTNVTVSEPVTVGGMNPEEGTTTETVAGPGMKDPLLSSWPFVIGISAAVLAISIVIGVFLAKRKIKKGIELYED